MVVDAGFDPTNSQFRWARDSARWFIYGGLFVAVSDAALGEIVRRHFESYAVARQHANAVAAELSGQVGQHGAFLIQLHAEQAAGEFLNYGSSHFNAVFFAHCPPRKIIAPPPTGRCGTPARTSGPGDWPGPLASPALQVRGPGRRPPLRVSRRAPS